jgi:uncharacterized heparinase superfamily protein
MARRPPLADLEPLKAWLRADPRAQWLQSWGLTSIRAVADAVRADWAGSAPHRWLISGPKPQGRAAAPTDPRPVHAPRGAAIMEGRFTFDGLTLEPGQGVEPWSLASPSRSFAVALHQMNWLPDLLAVEGGPRTALSLVLGWDMVFGRWNDFSWSAPVLERRVFNLACALKALGAEASAVEASLLLNSLARQARQLSRGSGGPARAAERACAAAVAGCCLAGKAGERLRGKALNHLERALPITVLPDGGHASRSPQAAMELLLDLRALDGGLQQLGLASPPVLARAIDRLAGAMGVLTLADGRLTAMQGGEAGDPAWIAAARAGDDAGAVAAHSLPHAGYEKLSGRTLQAIVDVGAPASGVWSVAACAHPLALEVLAGADRLIVGAGWSPRAPAGAEALRLTPAASTATVSDGSTGHPLGGARARVLGPRLEGAPGRVHSRRQDRDHETWLACGHDGWARAFGLIHQRRLYLDGAADELRGEDLLLPAKVSFRAKSREEAFLIVRFHLHPSVEASMALDQRSVLLRGPRGGWWLRNDAPDVRIEPSVHLADGRPQPSRQVAMRVLTRRDGTARIRWKLSAADSTAP